MDKTKSKKILYTLWLLSSALVLVNRYTALYINSTTVHFIVLYTAVTTSALILLGYLFNWKSGDATTTILFSTLVICFLKAFLTWGGDWKTQTVLFRSRENPKITTIEFQMRGDRFAFGYKKRIVERTRIMPFIDWTTDTDTATINPGEWVIANEIVNELKLPGEYVDLPQPDSIPKT